MRIDIHIELESLGTLRGVTVCEVRMDANEKRKRERERAHADIN